MIPGFGVRISYEPTQRNPKKPRQQAAQRRRDSYVSGLGPVHEGKDLRSVGEAAVKMRSHGRSYPTKDERQAWECVVCKTVGQADRDLEVMYC